jgi:isopenicillin N synthase-like dioxygenase
MDHEILDVDLLAFERGSGSQRQAVVDGVMRSLETGFVYTTHSIGESLLDDAYEMLAAFFELPTEQKAPFRAPGTAGQTGYTGLLVETAAISDTPDWKEMLNWGSELDPGHPLAKRYPHRYPTQVLPEGAVPGIAEVLTRFHLGLFELQRRFLRVIAVGLGANDEFFDLLVDPSTTLSRAIHYPAMDLAPGQGHLWAAPHGDINLITALPRATKRGLQVMIDEQWVDVAPPAEHAVINTGIMLERLSNGRIPVGWHQVIADPEEPGERYSVVQFCHPTPWTVLSPMHSCVTEDRPQRFAGVEAGNLLDQVLWEINLVEDAPRVKAEAEG